MNLSDAETEERKVRIDGNNVPSTGSYQNASLQTPIAIRSTAQGQEPPIEVS